MKNQRNKSSDRLKKATPAPHSHTPHSHRSDTGKKTPSGRVRRTPDGTVEENSEEAAP